jgi:DNA polymerase I-like protein with 3'-5' exonuclease and polymerase domains
MLEMLEGGADLHSITCQEVLGVSPDAPDFKFQRDIAKRLTFGGIFQVGAKTFQGTLSKLAHVDLPLQECEVITKRWRSAYPEFTRAYRDADSWVERHGWVELMRGNEYRTRSYFGPRDYSNTGWNRIVQGSLAEFLQLWLVAAERITNPRGGLDGPLILTVHDSLVLELPDDGDETPQVVHDVAEWAGREATRLFGIKMLADVGPWHK